MDHKLRYRYATSTRINKCVLIMLTENELFDRHAD